MILVGNQRGGSRDLARHLLKPENERVEVHQLRGFAGDTLHAALQESYALSRATRCKQHLFSLSLNPPPEERVSKAVFEEAADRIERCLGLEGQPRAIVFHEKNGRRHAHAVWCRIDPEKMKAVPLPFTRNKLQEVARELYIEHDWRMPRGFLDKELRDPRNFSLAEWQQAKRSEKDPKRLKAIFQDCWAISDSKATFAHALKERGFVLARGDRRGFVAVDHTGEAYAVSRWVGLKAKEIKARLGEPADLPIVEKAHVEAAKLIVHRLDELKIEQEREAAAKRQEIEARRARVMERHTAQRTALAAEQERRRRLQEDAQQARLRTGLGGWWDRIIGKRKRLEAENLMETTKSAQRDDAERLRLEGQHRDERHRIEARATALLAGPRHAMSEIADDIERLRHHVRPNDLSTDDIPERESVRPRRRERRRSRDGPQRRR
ncbi:MAG: relaxase/mobilization nuclease domain-containing protein [Pseudomonadota bacterium]